MVESVHKKLLVVSYYWLPEEGTGSYRISKFVKYLLLRGWEITVLTASQDPEGRYQPPEGLRVKRVGRSKSSAGSKKVNPSIFYAKDQNWKARLKVWARLNLIIPDAKIFWYPKAVKAGLKLAKKEKFSVLLSTAPPPSTALVAKKLAYELNLPWVADFRDPWTEIYYYEDFPQGALARRINKNLEYGVLRKADALVCVNQGFFPEHEAWLNHQYIISNGFDKDDFTQQHPEENAVDGKFSIAYLGSFKMNQLAPGFVEFLRSIPEEWQPRIRFEFIGNIDVLVREQLEENAPKALELQFPGMLPHREAVRKMQQSDLLLLLIGQAERSKLVYSTKLFEYLMSGKPTLAFGHAGGAAQQVIETSKGGYLALHREHQGALDYLAMLLKAWQSGQNVAGANQEALDRFDFKYLSERLEKILLDVERA